MCATGHPAGPVGGHPGHLTKTLQPPCTTSTSLRNNSHCEGPPVDRPSLSSLFIYNNPSWQHILPIDYDYLCQISSFVLKISRILPMLATKPQMMRLWQQHSSLWPRSRAPWPQQLLTQRERQRNKEEAKTVALTAAAVRTSQLEGRAKFATPKCFLELKRRIAPPSTVEEILGAIFSSVTAKPRCAGSPTLEPAYRLTMTARPHLLFTYYSTRQQH